MSTGQNPDVFFNCATTTTTPNRRRYFPKYVWWLLCKKWFLDFPINDWVYADDDEINQNVHTHHHHFFTGLDQSWVQRGATPRVWCMDVCDFNLNSTYCLPAAHNNREPCCVSHTLSLPHRRTSKPFTHGEPDPGRYGAGSCCSQVTARLLSDFPSCFYLGFFFFIKLNPDFSFRPSTLQTNCVSSEKVRSHFWPQCLRAKKLKSLPALCVAPPRVT